MINKQNMWFLTLFSIILVLSIYYVTLSDNSLSKIINENTTSVISSSEDDVSVVETEDDLTLERASREIESEEEYESLQSILLSLDSTLEEKNDAFDSIQQLNISKGKEEKLEQILKKEFDLNSVIKIDSNKIYITVSSNKGSRELANSIINKVQESFEKEIYITVNFQNSY